MSRISTLVDALVGVLVEQGFEHGTGRARRTWRRQSRLLTFSARSRRVSGGWSKATWQIRSKASKSRPTCSASASRKTPVLASSSMMACLRSASFQALRKSSSEAYSLRTVLRV